MYRDVRSFKLLFFMVFLACMQGTQAQNAGEAKRKGERAYALRQWKEAQINLAQYQEAKPGDFEVLTKLGIALYELKRGEEARKYLEYVAAKDLGNKNPDLFYYLARTRHGLGDWEKAILAYKAYLKIASEKHPLRANVRDNLRRCVSAMQIRNNESVALVENLGDQINSEGDEFAPIPSLNHADRLYFAAARPGSTGGRRNMEGFEDTERGLWCSDMYAGRLTNSGWELKGSLGGLLNTSRFEVPLGFNADGQILYFFRGFSLYSGEIFADTAAKKDEYALNTPAFLSPVQADQGDVNPFFFNDHTILFASRREGGFGGLDLWWTVWADTAWSNPVNLGPEINSAYDEDTPFLAKDGMTLYYSSNRTESAGGYDIFKAGFDVQKYVWQLPQNMAFPINSPHDDRYFRLSPDGKSAFFASDRLGGLGQNDIYAAYFSDLQEAQAVQVEQPAFTKADQNKPVDTEIKEWVIPTLAYTDDKDLLSAENRKSLDKFAQLAQAYPQTTLSILVHTDAGGQQKFDLYNGIKRGETIAKALLDRSIPAKRIWIRSVGSAYPLAREVLDATPNPAAPALNRRIELRPLAIDPPAIEFRLEPPFVSELMEAPGAKRLESYCSGLAYKVEVATTRQILTNDALGMFGDLMIESKPGSGAYQYTAGFFKQFQEAVQLRKELQTQGFTEARIIAYVNGLRISKAEAILLLKKYPDLAGFVKA